MFPYPKREENNQTQMNKTHTIGWAEESSGNTVLGIKCKTLETPSGGSVLKHQGYVCAPAPAAAQLSQEKSAGCGPKIGFCICTLLFNRAQKERRKKIPQHLVFQAVQHFQHVPPPPCSLSWAFGMMSSVTAIMKTAGRRPRPCCCRISKFPPSSLKTSGTSSSSNIHPGICPLL